MLARLAEAGRACDYIEDRFHVSLAPGEQARALEVLREHDDLRRQMGVAPRRASSGMGLIPLLIGAAVLVGGGGFLGWRISNNASEAKQVEALMRCRDDLLAKGLSLDRAIVECRGGQGALTWLVVGVAGGVLATALLGPKRR